MVDIAEVRQEELKRKKICRFCLSRVEADLTNIYARDQRTRTAPLPLQVMACVSIEVFSSDCMPVFVCQECRLMFDYCYRFKQMCKKADQSLRNYSITGQIIPEIEKPKIPPQILKKDLASFRNPLQQQSRAIKPVPQVQDIDEESSDTILTLIDDDQTDTPKQSPAQPPQQIQRRVPASSATDKTSHKLLNKAAIRILNKEAHQTPSEPIMSKPVLKQDEDGNLQVVTEILDRDDYSRNESEAIEKATVVETNVFPCPHCERSFPLRQLLDIHMVNHNRERSFACTDCDKSFYSKYDLQKHILVHTGERPFKCVVCNRGFTRSTLLHRHEKTHTDIPKFICVFCEKPFISQEEMEKHTERHRRKRPFTCKMCDKSFAFKQGLERHEVVHFKKQPFQCQYCVQSFSTPSKLARHLTAHAGDRPYPCKLCPKAYLLSHHLTRHMRSHKNGSGLYKCNDCDKNFSARDDLIYHSAVHATQTLVCPLCKDVFEDIETVTEHVKAHAEGEAYACEFCDLIFMTAERLQDHTDAEHAEDMVAYNQDDQANAAARQNKLNADTAQDVDEVIEEFLIEEFSDAGDTAASNIIVKEETDWQNARPTEQSNVSDESQETYLKEEDETVEEPPAKVSKPSLNVQKVTKAIPPANPPRKVAVKPVQRSPPVVLNSNSSSPKENKKPEKQLPVSPTVIKSEVVVPAPKVTKTRQPTIQQALQALPRGLSVKKVAPTTNTQQTTPTQKLVTQSPAPTKKSSTAVSSVREELGVLTSPESGAETKESPKPNLRMLRQRSEASPNVKAKSTTPTSSPNVEDVKKPLQKTTPVPQKKSNTMPEVDNKIVEMMIGDKKVKVQRITMTKAQAAAMAREGRIQMKEGTMILKKDPNLKSAKKSS